MPQVTFLPDNIEISVERGKTILQAAQQAGVYLGNSCGGQGMCTSCRVVVKAGAENLSRVGRGERKMLSEEELKQQQRLGCQTLIQCLSVVIQTRS